MRAYIIRRLLLIIPTLFILTILVFLAVRFLPGDVIDVIMSKMFDPSDPLAVDREAVERMLGLDVPVHVQYGRWIGVLPTPDWVGEYHFKGLLQATLGESLYGGYLSVEEEIIGRLPLTIELGVMAIVIGLVIALPVGTYSAIRQDTVADYLGRTAAVIGLATPNFWLGIMVMIYPVIWWGWTPPMEWVPFTEDPLGNLGMFLIPSLILGTAMAAATMRMTRTMMLEVLRQDYIRTAWSQGSQGEGSYYQTRPQECPHPGGYVDRAAVAYPEQYGDYSDWKNVVGTGPFILTDYVEGVSKTYAKNPDYWGYDEKYPENRLPYIDQLRALFIAEEALVYRHYARVRLI